VTYRIDPCGAGGGPPPDATIVLVGSGGTGGYLAEAVCRLLIGRRGSLHLVDMDRVEERNVGRQTYLYGMSVRLPIRRHTGHPTSGTLLTGGTSHHGSGLRCSRVGRFKPGVW
jgi:hypothetical protein